MSDTFLLGAGFSKAICETMPTMRELYNLLEPLSGMEDGFSREAYEYASGNVETLLSYYAIPSPHDDTAELLRKQRVTVLLENRIGKLLQNLEEEGLEHGLNSNGKELVSRWHEQRSHILTTNYDTLVERIAGTSGIHDRKGRQGRVILYGSLSDSGHYCPSTRRLCGRRLQLP